MRAVVKYFRTNYWDHTMRDHQDLHKPMDEKLIK